jgi:phosphonate transport system substrate-binding protein
MMTTKLSQTLLTALLLVVGLTMNQAAAETEQVYLGSVAMDVPVSMVQRFTLLTEYLSSKTGLKVTFHASPSLDVAVSDLGNNRTQIAYLTPVAYIKAHKEYNARALVSPLTMGESTFKLVVVVRQDSPFKTMLDLRGKSFAFGDEKAILQRAVVIGSGIKLEELSHYTFLKHYDNVAKAVLNKDFDAGIIRESIAVEFRNKGLRVIYYSEPLPAYVFAVSSNLAYETVYKLRDSLLALKADSPEHNAILKELDKGYDGFTKSNDSDYDIVRKMIAPFELHN